MIGLARIPRAVCTDLDAHERLDPSVVDPPLAGIAHPGRELTVREPARVPACTPV